MRSRRTTRILLGKVGMDAHNIGIKYLARVLRDAGYEVIYLGLYLSCEKVVAAAIEEDVDIIGLSFLGGDHLSLTHKLLNILKKENMEVPVIVGGVIPRQDFTPLKEMGVDGLFQAGTPVDSIIEWIKKNTLNSPETSN